MSETKLMVVWITLILAVAITICTCVLDTNDLYEKKGLPERRAIVVAK